MSAYKDGLLRAAESLVNLIEGVGSKRWNFEGFRLKDTNEWAAFYVATKRAEAEQQQAPGMTNDELAQAIKESQWQSRNTGKFEPQHKLFVAHLEKLLAEQYRRAAQEAK